MNSPSGHTVRWTSALRTRSVQGTTLSCVRLAMRSLATMTNDDERSAQTNVNEVEAKARRTRRQVPKSLPDYASSKSHFSVTDLVSPLWCEFAFQYGILGMRHLPVEQRPSEIVTPSGHTVRPDAKVAEKRERILVKGRKVHKKLEKEVHPVKVYVETTTEEDIWGLRILRMVSGLRTLMDSGCCRELPVFGLVHGRLVVGVIDEISRRPLSRRLNKYLDEEEVDSRPHATLSAYFSTQNPPIDINSDLDHANSTGTKRWTSQEEWKKSKRRSEASKTPKRGTNKSAKTSVSSNSQGSGQQSLAAFFGGSGPTSVETNEAQKDRFGFFLEDSKTRNARLLPPLEDQEQARIQCMLYKRLFDGILLGLIGTETRPEHGRAAETLAVDAHSAALDCELLFKTLGLDVQANLSEEFVRDAEKLIQGFQSPSNGSSNQEFTLSSLIDLLRTTLANLACSAREGLGWNSNSSANSGILQSHLRLTYRKRKGKFRRAYQDQKISREDNSEPRFSLGENGENEDIELAIALQLGLDATVQDSRFEEEALQSHSISLPTSTPSDATKQEQSSDEEEDNTLTSPSKPKKDVLGTVTFLHDADRLEAHLADVLKMWDGERDLRGVTLEQSWRCHHCEFRHDCEWREAKGQEKLDEFSRTKLARRGAEELAASAATSGSEDGHDSKSSSDDADNAKKNGKGNAATSNSISRVSFDDEESLWSQFHDIQEEDLQK